MTEPTRTFDGSSAGPTHHGMPDEPSPFDSATLATGADSADDTLALLRSTVEERIETTEYVVTVPGGRIRLHCRLDISSAEMSKWQKRALPPVARKRNAVSMIDMDPGELAGQVFLHTCERVEVLDRDNVTWRAIEDRDHEPLTLRDPQLLQAFGAMDSRTALRKLFGKDAFMVQASSELLTEAGWGVNSEADPEDPTQT